MKQLICKTESLIKRVRWKVFHLLHNSAKNSEQDKDPGENEKRSFGFRTMATPPKNPLLYDFEADMYNMISGIQFQPIKNSFQNQLRKDLQEITRNDKLYVNADKTRNLYVVKPEEYEKLLKNNVTKNYKKCPSKKVEDVNKEASKIVPKDLLDRVQVLSQDPAFITIKDHKPNFPRNIACRLLNPSKSQVGKISKNYLEEINSTIRRKTNYNQWRNTMQVIDWFKNLPNKKSTTFVMFDIVSFYPSITLEILQKALKFAETYCRITPIVIDTILNARKSFLFYKGEPWIKKDHTDHFDVTEGSFDGAEVCELVGLYMLDCLQGLVGRNNSVGLYRDDGLMAIQGSTGRQKDKLRKNIEKTFKDNGFGITCEVNLDTVSFLDVEFNLPLNKYFPYRKPNDVPMYVNKNSNHPPHVLKQIPKMTSTRLSDLSSTEEEFQKIVPEYKDVLQKSGFKEDLKYSPKKKKKRVRKRNILWYNPPFDKQVKNNVARNFLKIVEKNFPKHHKFHKILNSNNIKVSYSCMPNMAAKISSHNKRTLKNYEQQPSSTPKTCNCRKKDECPLDGKCLSQAVIYEAHIKSDNGDEGRYLGQCEPEFKTRWRDYKTSFKYDTYDTKTELSAFYWNRKKSGINSEVKFSIKKQSFPYRAGSDKCDLCLTEKLLIMKEKDHLINEKNELVSKCRHINKFLLGNQSKRRKKKP